MRFQRPAFRINIFDTNMNQTWFHVRKKSLDLFLDLFGHPNIIGIKKSDKFASTPLFLAAETPWLFCRMIFVCLPNRFRISIESSSEPSSTTMISIFRYVCAKTLAIASGK